MSFGQQCIALRKKDHSLLEIVKITGRSKSSVYFHIRDLPLSQKRQRLAKKISGDHIRRFAIARRGKSVRPFKRFTSWTPEMVLLVSHLMFDGEIQRGVCTYNNRSLVLIERVEDLMKNLYTFEPKRVLNIVTGVTRTAYYNVELGTYLKGKAIELLKDVVTMSRPLQREFLRAFFDDEGCMDFRPTNSKRNVRGYQKNIHILKIVQSVLLDFAITSIIHKPNEVVISGKENLRKFQKEINFSPGVQINGGRSNSIWKQPLEKRELLERAIASYQSR